MSGVPGWIYNAQSGASCLARFPTVTCCH
jgi:hypothetical protein